MKKRKIKITHIVFALLIFSSCKTLKTNLSIPERKMPASFTTSTDTNSVAGVNWRQYFADENLIALIDTALSNNFDLQMALQNIETYRSQVKIAKAAQAPVVNANTTFWQRKFGFYTMDDAGNRVTEFAPGDTIPKHLPDFFAGLTTNWEVDVWGKIKNQKKAAISNFLASIEGRNFVISNLVADIAIAYNELLALDNELEIMRQTIQNQQEALDIVKAQKETGRANELAVQQFQAQLLQSKVMEREILQGITEIENSINFLLGRFPRTIKRTRESLFKEIPAQIASGIPSQLLTMRPDIREAEFQLQASKFNLQATKALFFPTFNISAALGFQAYKATFLFATPESIMYSLLGSLVAPVVNRKAINAQFSNAKANQLAAMYNYQKAILNGYVEVANELSNIENLKEIHSLKKRQSEVLVLSVETSTELYKTARANYLEVLFAQQNALQAQLDLVSVLKRQRIATVIIYKALGGGWK
jgi:multidrug efflux system outer membrane protein